jgi:metallo-beta-lactamase family protein
MKITFHGGVRTVTGSKHLLELPDCRLLLECGLFQGRRDEARRRNSEFPFDPGSIDAVILSHAHIDHAGALPALVRAGFSGPVYATAATADLCSVLLHDSAQISQRDAYYLNKRREKGQPPVEPLYTVEDVEKTLPLLEVQRYDDPFSVSENVTAILREAGHILGAAQVQLKIRKSDSDEEPFRLGFTGDLGRDHLPILRDPYQLDGLDALITESTYGDRLHERGEDLKSRLERVVYRTVEKGGRLLIPAFAVGRTQRVVYLLHKLFEERRLPQIPIYVDSPMASEATEVYRRHPECFDREASEWLERDDILGFRRLRYVQSVEESKRLNDFKIPCVIIASSGMAEAGRILHHLIHGIGNPRNTVLIVGYCASHTLGRRLTEKQPVVKILGQQFKLRAHVEQIDGLSTHADRDELIDYMRGMSSPPRTVYIVHGDEKQSLAHASHLRGEGFDEVHVPHEGDSFDLLSGMQVGE